MEKDLSKLGAKALVRRQGFNKVDFRFIHLTMMKREVYVIEEGFGDLRDWESRGRCYMFDECILALDQEEETVSR